MYLDDSGRSVRRIEDVRFLTGRGRYAVVHVRLLGLDTKWSLFPPPYSVFGGMLIARNGLKHAYAVALRVEE